MQRTTRSKIGSLLGLVLVTALTGCVGYVEEPRTVYVPPPPAYVEPVVVVPDHYVYYPRYEVYYNPHHHHYVYREGRTWVARPTPPRISVDVLFGSPSVNLNFRDTPSHHHSRVARQYPRHWKPPGHGRGDQGHGRGNQGRGNRNDHDGRR